MKKLMITAAIVCAAAFAKAATVTWSTGTIYLPGADGTGYDSSDGTVEVGATGYTSLLIVGSSFNDGVIGDRITFTAGYEIKTPIDSFNAQGGIASSVPLADAMYYGQVIVTAADGSTLTSDVFTFNTYAMSEDTSILIGDGGDGIAKIGGGDWTNSQYGAFSQGWQSVPEPTSGLLLLLGVAGLALKRKRA